MTETKIKRLRDKYPSGARVKLIQMDDPYRKIPKGAMGTVDEVDDIGTVHVNWDDGFSLGLVPGTDKFEVVQG